MSPDREARMQRIDENIVRLETIFGKMEAPDLVAFESALKNEGPMTGVLAEFCEQAPVPMWLKNREGKMLWFNEAYTSIYGDFASVKNYVGSSDKVAWDSDTALGFDKNDKKVIETMQPVFCIEKLWNRKYEEYEQLAVIKWPVSLDNKVAVGVAGVGLGFHRIVS
jgi:PAS domain-containing protein